MRIKLRTLHMINSYRSSDDTARPILDSELKGEMKIQYFDKNEFEEKNKNINLVEDFGLSDEDAPKLFFNSDDDSYYARGYWNGPKYNFLRYAKIDFIDIDTWINNMRNTLHTK